jgi:hypothetical protein
MIPNIKTHKIILGTGFNKWLLGPQNTILTDWNTLLQEVAKEIQLDNFDTLIQTNEQRSSPTFVWETLILFYCQKHPEYPMNQCENKLLRIISKLITNETNKIINDKNVSERFHKFWNAISKDKDKRLDIITLNFDLIIESLLKMKTCEAITWHESKDEVKTLTKLHKKVMPASHFQKDNVYIWHPHGHIKHPNSMIVGLHRYVQAANQIFNDFNDFKKYYANLPTEITNEPNFDPHHHHEGIKKFNSTTTWLASTINHSLLFVGVGLSIEEFDIWEYIHLRFRNHARIADHKPNIIRFTCTQDNNNITHWNHLSQLLHIQNESFGDTWEEAWTNLIEKLNS